MVASDVAGVALCVRDGDNNDAAGLLRANNNDAAGLLRALAAFSCTHLSSCPLPHLTRAIARTDIFFGDMSQGRMNQIVPQLLLGAVLNGSTGPPDFNPTWGTYTTWMFGAHYFFEIYNMSTMSVDAKAAYGPLFPTVEGEVLFTNFSATEGPYGPAWHVSMGVVGDATRVSTLVIEQPYMGLGTTWEVPTTSWAELNYTNVCVNACWEIYGGVDPAHLPSSGAHYDVTISRGAGQHYPWVRQWDEDEGAKSTCFASSISEHDTPREQYLTWDITLPKEGAA